MKHKILRLFLAFCLFLSACTSPPEEEAVWQPENQASDGLSPEREQELAQIAAQTGAAFQAEEALAERLLAVLDTAPVLSAADGRLRKFPYPYQAMFCITSDCDSATKATFERMHRFLNTFAATEYGPGLGLDIADSFFIYNGSNSSQADNLLTYCAFTDPATLQDAEFIRKYYACGWYDSIHSFGDFSHSRGTLFSRTLAEGAWQHLNEAGIAPTIWIDHGNATNVQNFGAYSPFTASRYQAGDDAATPYYHTDITLANSIRYTWYSRHSDEFGQDFPLSLRKLRDGQKVWSFTRYTSEMRGRDIDWLWRPHRLQEQITAERLDRLEQKGQYAIIAQHLTIFQEEDWLTQEGVAALRLLAERHHERRSILVTRTSRLLDYAVAQKYLRYQVAEAEGYTAIRILEIADPLTGARPPREDELTGLTFYCPEPEQTVVFVGQNRLSSESLQYNAADLSGQRSISIPWYPADTKDYTQED